MVPTDIESHAHHAGAHPSTDRLLGKYLLLQQLLAVLPAHVDVLDAWVVLLRGAILRTRGNPCGLAPPAGVGALGPLCQQVCRLACFFAGEG